MGRLLLLSFLLCASSIYAQQDCPIVTISTQKFCMYQWSDSAGESKRVTISDLSVGDGGDGVQWYSEAEGGMPLSPDDYLMDGKTYYADNKSGTCTRISVNVVVDANRPAGKTSQAYLCSSDESIEIWNLIDQVSADRPNTPNGTVSLNEEDLDWTLVVPKDIVSGTTFKYTAPPTEYGICNDGKGDFTFITIFVAQSPDAGSDGKLELLSTDGEVNLIDHLNGTPQGEGSWSPELDGESGKFNPAVHGSGSYTYNITTTTTVGNDATGPRTITCSATATVEVIVHQVVNGKVVLCHNGKSLEVNIDAVDAHRNHGDSLGACESSISATVVSPNPSHGDFNFSNSSAAIKKIRILNFDGSVVKEVKTAGETNLLEVDLSGVRKGIYFAEVVTPNGKEVLRLVKK